MGVILWNGDKYTKGLETVDAMYGIFSSRGYLGFSI